MEAGRGPTDLQSCLNTWAQDPSKGYIKKIGEGQYEVQERGIGTFFNKIINPEAYSLEQIAKEARALVDKGEKLTEKSITALNTKISQHNAIHARIDQLVVGLPVEGLKKDNIEFYLDELESLCEHRDKAEYDKALSEATDLKGFLEALKGQPLKIQASLSMEEQRVVDKFNDSRRRNSLTSSENKVVESLKREGIMKEDGAQLVFTTGPEGKGRQSPYQKLRNKLLEKSESLGALNTKFDEWKFFKDLDKNF